MQPSENCYKFIRSWEGLWLVAKLDSGGVPTIGFGTIEYPDGTPVKVGDTCTEEQAQEWLKYEVDHKTASLNKINLPTLTQNQFDSIVSFCYNEGFGAFKGSTLYRKMLVNPNDQTIYNYDHNNPVKSCEFLKWVYDNGEIVHGLVNRRMAEADFYKA